MGIVETTAKRRAASADESPDMGEAVECLFCRRTAEQVTFVVQDRVHRYNVCENCIDDCARTVACSCVC